MVVLILLLASYLCMKSHINSLILLLELLAACEVTPMTRPVCSNCCIAHRPSLRATPVLGQGSLLSQCPVRLHRLEE